MKSCLLCGETRATRVFANNQLEVLRCAGCGLVYQADYAAALARMNEKFQSVEDYYEHRRDNSAKIIAYDPERLRRTADIHDYLLEVVP